MPQIWLDVLDEIARTCVAHGRSDLLPWLRQRRAHLLDPALRVLIIGEPKQGKSQLVNALVNAPACPVGDGPTTVVTTVVRYAEAPEAVLVRDPSTTAGQPPGADPGLAERIPVPVAQIPAAVAGKIGRRPGSGVHVEIGLPRTLLRAGLVLIDSPGSDELEAVDRTDPAPALSRADTVLMVSDSARDLSPTELAMLQQVTRVNPNVTLVQTKTDLVPHWRLVAERNRQKLADAGIQVALIPVSAALRLHAAGAKDRGVNAESGFPALIARLTKEMAGKADVLAPRLVTLITRTVIEELATPLRAELARHEEQEQSGPMAKLHAAQREIDELRRCSARWQNMLADDMADLLSDVEHDLRDRTRQILRVVNDTFDDADPLADWPVFEEWLEQSLIEAAEANRAWLAQRCEWTARRLADNFARYADDVLPAWSVTVPDDLAEQLPVMRQPVTEQFTTSQKLFAGIKGSYGGLLMFGLAMTLAGMPMINPVSVGAGVLFGGKGIRDEGKSLLRRRQAATKTAVQQYVDDFYLQMSKDCRDTVRQVHRMFRNHFTALTDDFQDAIVQSLRRAKQEADSDAAVREQRRREIQQKMQGLAALYAQSQRLATTPNVAQSLGTRA